MGLHNGKNVNLYLKPAEVNHGIKFKRIDIDSNNIIEASYKNVKSPVLCTRIENSGFNSKSNPKYRLIIKDTKHLDYSDIPLFSPIIGYVLDVGSNPAELAVSLINRLVHSFLEQHLLGQSNDIFDNTIENDLIYQIP